MKIKVLSLLAIALSVSTLLACGNTTTNTTSSNLSNIGKNDSVNLDSQIAEYLFAATGHYELYKYDTTGSPIPVDKDMTCYLTDYDIISDTEDEIIISGKLQNEYYIAKDPANITFQILENNDEKYIHLSSFNDVVDDDININIVPIISFGKDAMYKSGIKIHIHEPGKENADLDSFILNSDTVKSIEWDQECLVDDVSYIGKMVFTTKDGKKIQTRDTFTFEYAPASIKDYDGEALWKAGGTSTNNIDAYYCK